MAPLPPQAVRAVADWYLQFAVEDLEAAYRASLGGLTHLEEDIERDVREALGIGAGDEFPEINSDNPDDPIALLYDEAGERAAQAKRSEPLVRKAFLIALFHAWERHCCKIMKATHCGADDMRQVLGLTAFEWSTHPIYHLQLAANCAKHGPGTSAARLYALRPDLFPRAKSSSEASDWTLHIPAHVLDDWFVAMRRIARRGKSNQAPSNDSTMRGESP